MWGVSVSGGHSGFDRNVESRWHHVSPSHDCGLGGLTLVELYLYNECMTTSRAPYKAVETEDCSPIGQTVNRTEGGLCMGW